MKFFYSTISKQQNNSMCPNTQDIEYNADGKATNIKEGDLVLLLFKCISNCKL